MHTLGTETKSIFEHTPEAHKLRIEFQVQAGQSVNKGDLVVLHTDGTVRLAGAAAPRYTILGVALDSAAASEFVTIAVRGYAVVLNAEGNAAVVAGPVQLGAWNAGTKNREYGPAAGADDQVKDTLAIGFNLINTAADGNAAKILLI